MVLRALLSLFSLIITFYLGNEFFRTLDSFVPVVSELFIGEKVYSIYQADRCVGEAKVILDHPNQELWTLSIDGYLVLAKVGDAKLLAELSFNSLGQLGGSMISGSLGNIQFKGGTIGVKPMRVIFREPKSFEVTFKGPVLLNKNKDKYSIVMPLKKSLRAKNSPFRVKEIECINKGEAELVTIPDIIKEQA